MNLETRMKHIVRILNETDKELTATEIASKYSVVDGWGSSDVLSTGSILNVMSHLGLVKKIPYSKGKSTRYRFRRTGNHMITMVE